MIAINFLVERLEPKQSDINLLQELSKIDCTQYATQIYCSEIVNLPIKTTVPVYQLYHATNLRSDKHFGFYFANSYKLIPTLRYLSRSGVNGKFYVYCDCPQFMYPKEKHKFVEIINTLKSEFVTITGSITYQKILRDMGVCVHDMVIENYWVESIVEFIQEEYDD
jgi:hypothetical protein